MAKTDNGIRKQFEAYSKLDKDVDTARETLEAAVRARSACVQVIMEEHGTGPFKYAGRLLTGVHRKPKGAPEDSKEGTYFFKSPGSSEIIEV